jgi:hypothetical protein
MNKVFGISINGEFIGYVYDENSAKNLVEKLSFGAEEEIKKLRPNRTLYQERNNQRNNIKVYSMTPGKIVDGYLKCRAIVMYDGIEECSFEETSSKEETPSKEVEEETSLEEIEEETIIEEEEETSSKEEIEEKEINVDCEDKKSLDLFCDHLFEDLPTPLEKLNTFGPIKPSFENITVQKEMQVEENSDKEVKIRIENHDSYSSDSGSTLSEDDSEYIAPTRSRIPFLYPQPHKILKYMGA